MRFRGRWGGKREGSGCVLHSLSTSTMLSDPSLDLQVLALPLPPPRLPPFPFSRLKADALPRLNTLSALPSALSNMYTTRSRLVGLGGGEYSSLSKCVFPFLVLWLPHVMLTPARTSTGTPHTSFSAAVVRLSSLPL
jgi:hypothetical protein